MRVLLLKTSSMGDLLHTLPALTDAARAIPGICFDWVVEEDFTEIPAWHPGVDRVIPVALRRWRKRLWAPATWREVGQVKKSFAEHHYDLIIDAQGLVKSAWLTWLLQGRKAGLDWHSAREPFAAFFYREKHAVDKGQHAVARTRSLFAAALGYAMPTTPPEFGLTPGQFPRQNEHSPYLVFLHGTTWSSKQWPESYWTQLAKMAASQGYRIKMSGGNSREVDRAERIAKACDAVDVMPYLKIATMASLLAGSKGAVAVDTGFGHLAAAINVPTISIYGSTDPSLTGALGEQSRHLIADFSCSPCLSRDCTYRGVSDVKPACYQTIPPNEVWQALQEMVTVSS